MRPSRLIGAFLTKLLVAGLSEGLLMDRLFAQWIPQLSGTAEQLNDIAIVGSTSALVVGNNGIILKTTNLGAAWTPRTSGTTQDLRSVAYFFGSMYAVGANVICYSSDRGDTWSCDTSSHNFTVVAYGAIVNPTLYMGTESGVLRYKVGSWWEERSLHGGSVVCIGLQYAAGQTTEVFVATHDYAYHTIHGWFVWDSTVVPRLPWDTLTGGDFRNWAHYLVGWGGNPGPQPFVLRRANWFDTTWQRFSLPAPFLPTDVRASWTGHMVYVSGSNSTIYRSVDSCVTWNLQYGNAAVQSPVLRAMAFHNDTVGYAVGDSGTILFTSNGGVTSVTEGNNVPNMFALWQNYPNPFNSGTVITYQVPLTSRVTLKVYSLLGQEVATLVNETRPAGTHKIWFDAARLASGVYLYQLITEDFVATKKFVLIR